MKLILARIGNNSTIKYAFDELVRCLEEMDDSLFLDRRVYDRKDVSKDDVLWIGLDGSIPYSVDDEICIDIKNGAGAITGSNERSVLMGVYRFLYEMGCRFIRPGKDGEIIKKRTLDKGALGVKVSEKPSYRHRAVCIEGANDYQHVADMIDWLPKIGMNGYFVQFHTPYFFFDTWYRHDGNPTLEGDTLSREDVKHIWKRLEEEVLKRGLMYHAVGHGWTCEPFGLDGGGWIQYQGTVPEETKQYLAQVDGVRELWKNSPLDTNLCYSNQKVRDIMTDAVVDYCKENPAVSHLHFWLADQWNNHCECEECQKMRPADFYVKILNELDEKLTNAGIATKIVFLVYLDLLWSPEFEKIQNPDRFVLMFAPITRTYTKAYVEDYKILEDAQMPPYVRNKIGLPSSVAENITHLYNWQKQFDGDSFDFDYHMMWDHLFDPGYYECARILHTDMVNLDKIGLNGMVSCQNQRVFLPTGLPMYAMARGLWDKNSDFQDISGEYFEAAFDEYADEVENYMSTLSRLFHPPYFRQELPQTDEKLAEDFSEVIDVVKAFRSTYIEQNKNKNASWMYLSYHAEYCLLLADVLRLRALGEMEASKHRAEDLKQYLYQTEMATHRVFDTRNALLKKIFGRFAE